MLFKREVQVQVQVVLHRKSLNFVELEFKFFSNIKAIYVHLIEKIGRKTRLGPVYSITHPIAIKKILKKSQIS